MTTTHTATIDHPGYIIEAQIPRGLRLAVGYRSPMLTNNGLTFQVRGTCAMIVTVELDRARDLYDVKVQVKRQDGKGKIRFDQKGLYVDQMVDVIDLIDRGAL